MEFVGRWHLAGMLWLGNSHRGTGSRIDAYYSIFWGDCFLFNQLASFFQVGCGDIAIFYCDHVANRMGAGYVILC